MNQRPDARPEPMPDALPLDLLPPLDRDSQISRPNPPGGDHRPVLQPEEAAGGSAGTRVDLLPSRLLIGKDGETRSIWPVHLGGWQALGWQVLTPAMPAEGDPGEAGEPEEPDPDQALAPDLGPGGPELGQPGPESDLEPAPDPGPVPTRPEEPVPDHQASDGPQPAAPEPTELQGQGADGEQQLAPPDFAAMTKAEIIQYCSSHYGVLLDSSLTKGALVSEAEALAGPRLPDALMDDLMT